MIIGVTMVAALIVVPWLLFALTALFQGFPRLRLGQDAGLVAVAAWVFTAIVSRDLTPLMFFTLVGSLLAFAAMWRREFGLLMARHPDEFPSPYDRLAWMFVLTAMAPAGVWFFRSYRKARWPETPQKARLHPIDADTDLERIGA
jgi:hypothetical protein